MTGSTDSAQGLDLERLATYLRVNRPDLLPAGPTATLIAGGRSNLTYLVVSGDRRWVLRRPPLGHVLASAHDMGREFRAISALAATAVPVPGALLYCADVDVIGAPFYLMDFVEGAVIRTRAEAAEALSPAEAHRLSLTLVDVLVDLHALDPAAVGLADFGRPDGYLSRQLRRWWQQFESSRSRPIEGIERLRDALGAELPTPQRASVIHGDFRIDNTVLRLPDTVAAVLDWEMATLGDPLADVGMLSAYWDLGGISPGNPITTAADPGLGFASTGELFARYAERSGLDLTPMPWYAAFSRLKLAVILEGIHYRHLHGQTIGEGFSDIGELTVPLVRSGLTALTRDPGWS